MYYYNYSIIFIHCCCCHYYYYYYYNHHYYVMVGLTYILYYIKKKRLSRWLCSKLSLQILVIGCNRTFFALLYIYIIIVNLFWSYFLNLSTRMFFIHAAVVENRPRLKKRTPYSVCKQRTNIRLRIVLSLI